MPRDARVRDQLAVGVLAHVDDGGDRDAGIHQVERHLVGGVVVGEDDRALARRGAVAVDVGLRGRSQHAVRPVVVEIDHRPLDRAGRQDHVLGAHAPQALARLAQRFGRGRIEMIRHPLHQADHVVVVIAEGHRARQQRHVRHRAQLCERIGDPLGSGLAVDHRLAIGEERAAHLLLLVHQHHARAGSACSQGSRQARWAGANDQGIGMGVELVVAVGIGFGRALAEAGHAADEVLVLQPEALRPHEGLVVEARWKTAVEQAVHRAEIGGQAGKAVLAFRDQTLIELDLRRAQVGLGAVALAELDQRIRLLRAGGKEAARAVILEAAADQHHAVGEQRGGEGIAVIALVRLAVEHEAQRLGAVDAAALRQAIDLAHQPFLRSIAGAGWPIS